MDKYEFNIGDVLIAYGNCMDIISGDILTITDRTFNNPSGFDKLDAPFYRGVANNNRNISWYGARSVFAKNLIQINKSLIYEIY